MSSQLLTSNENPQIQRVIILSLILGLCVLEIIASIGLFADGSFFLANILGSKNFYFFYKARLFSQIIPQVPLFFAIKLGVTHINNLMILHSIGLVGIPLFLWISSLILQIKTDLFWYFVIAFSLCYLSSGFFAVGEYNLSYSLVALISSLLLQEKIGRMKKVILVLASFAITLTYETMIFFGPMLLAISMISYLIHEKNQIFSIILFLISLFFLSSFFIAVVSLLNPGAGHPSGAFGDALGMMTSIHFMFYLIMGYLCIKSIGSSNKIYLFWGLFIAFIHVINTNCWSLPEMNYRFRLLSGMMLFVMMLMTSLYQYAAKNNFKTIRFHSYLMPMLFFISSIIPYYLLSLDFYEWGRKYEQEIYKSIGVTSIKDSELSNSIHTWFWTNACTSMVLGGFQTHSLITNGNNISDQQSIDPYRTGLYFSQINSKKLDYLQKEKFYYRDLGFINKSLSIFFSLNHKMHGIKRPDGNLPGAG